MEASVSFFALMTEHVLNSNYSNSKEHGPQPVRRRRRDTEGNGEQLPDTTGVCYEKNYALYIQCHVRLRKLHFL